MERFKPYMRWAAAALAAIALVFAFVTPRRSDPVTLPDDSPPPAAQPDVPSAAPSPAVPAASAELAVYVVGAVRHAGVYRLATGSRVVDAVNDAGGFSSDADPEAINLAAPLVDGVKVDVPKKGARPAYAVDDASGAAADAFATSAATNSTPASSRHSSHHRSSGRSGATKLAPGQTIDVNTASETDLERLPGVGPSLARRIVEYRQANGPFATPDDLQNVSGIGPSKFAKMEPFIRV
jgi:competence protein ComEA